MSTDNSDISTEVSVAVAHWPEMANSVFVPHPEDEYRRLVAFLEGVRACHQFKRTTEAAR
jgi:hypothetical protein